MTVTPWQVRHYEGLTSPRGAEIALVTLMNAVENYLAHAESDSEWGEWRDYVLTPGIGRILEGFIDLLNGDLGRLDGGALYQWVYLTAARIGWDVEAGEMSGS